MRCKLNTDIYKEPGNEAEAEPVNVPSVEGVLNLAVDSMNKVIDKVVDTVSEVEQIAAATVIDMPNSISDA